MRTPHLLATFALGAALFLLPGCAADPTRPTRPARPALTSVERQTVPEQVATASTSRLRGARVRRTGEGLEVLSWWGCREPGCQVRGEALVRRGPSGTTYRRLQRADRVLFSPGDHLPPVPGLGRLITAPAASLTSTGRAVVAGGDGATLLPFERVARSVDGADWEVHDVPRVAGERAYVSGQVVLPDGRLLVLLEHWSGDRRNRPSERHSGLWVSNHAWTGWEPYVPSWLDPPRSAPDDWSALVSLDADPARGGALWMRTWDDRLLVSTDGGRAFRDVPVR